MPEAVWTYRYGVAGVTEEETTPTGQVNRRTSNGRGKLLKEEKKDLGGTRPTSNVFTVDYTYDGPWEKQRSEAEGSWSKTRKQALIDDRGRVLSAEETWSAADQSYRYATDTTWTGLAAVVTENWSTVSDDRTSTVLSDSFGNVLTRTAGGLTDAWKYDAAGKPVSEQRAGKPARTYGYHQDDLVTVTYADEVTSNRYWPSGRLASTTEPSGRKKTYAWYDRGLLKTEEYGVGSDVDRRERPPVRP